MDWAERANNLVFNGKAFIDGQYAEANSKRLISVSSPIDGRELGSFAACDDIDIERAVSVARKAYEDGRWRYKSLAERKQILIRLAGLIQEHAQELALLDTLSMGKSINQCLYNDIPLAVQCIQWYAEAIDKIYDECVPPRPGALGLVTREPLGVVGAITPWNYPMENISWKIGPALAGGNCLVLKPAEQSAFSALFVGQLALEAGIPEGVLNIVPGAGEVAGAALALHGDVDAVFFTGSTEVGKLILQYAGQSNIKRVALECGGKSPYIVLDDCDRLDEAADILAQNIFMNQGQTCSAPSRLILSKSIRNRFLDSLLDKLDKYCPDNPLLEDTLVGSMSSHEQLDKVLGLIESGKVEGARLIAGGARAFPLDGGAYCMPTVFDNVTEHMAIAQEEIFGPVLSVLEAKSVEHAVYLANASRYGLAGAVWTQDIDQAHRVAREVRVGTMHINSYGMDDITAPFGGYKQSGNGSKDKSLHVLDDFTNMKTTWLELR